MRLGELLAIARECKGLALRDLEELTGISNGLLSQMETGHVKQPSFWNMVRISKALNISLERFASCDEWTE